MSEYPDPYWEKVEERYRKESGPVKTTIDLTRLESLTAGAKDHIRKQEPYLSIYKNLIRLSAAISRGYKDGDRLEVLANKHIIAVREKKEAGVPCKKRKEHNNSAEEVILICRTYIIRELGAKGWQVGTRVPLTWDPDGKFWWGRKPEVMKE